MTREEAIKVLKKDLQIIDDPKVTMTAREWEEHDDNMRDALEIAIKALEQQTDEIVRCKDCKWYENACTFFAADPFERAPMEKNDFCSYGERRIENLTVKLSKEQPRQDVN